jgi:hypothetical protein
MEGWDQSGPRPRWDQNGPSGDCLGGWSGFTLLRMSTVGGCFECGDEPSGSGAAELVTRWLSSGL